MRTAIFLLYVERSATVTVSFFLASCEITYLLTYADSNISAVSGEERNRDCLILLGVIAF
jgi:hypothetical protein